jgi:nitroreductase
MNNIEIIKHNFNNIVKLSKKYRKSFFPNRTNEGYKCDRDISSILVSYIIDLENNTQNNTKMVAASFWKNGKRVLKEYKTEVAVHNYIVETIITKILKISKDTKFAKELVELKNIIVDTLANGIDEKTEFLHIIYQSQKCQRNWNLDKIVDIETVKWLLEVGYTTPTKHNLDTFDIVAVTDREKIERFSQAAVYSEDNNSILPKDIREGKRVQNPQTNSNVLFLFFVKQEQDNDIKRYRNPAPIVSTKSWLKRVNLEIGIAASAMAIAANQFGMKTGFCKCCDYKKMPTDILDQLNLRVDNFVIFLGVGYPKDSLTHEEHVDGNRSVSHGKLKKDKIII